MWFVRENVKLFHCGPGPTPRVPKDPRILDSRHMYLVRFSALHTSRLYPQDIPLAPFSVTGWVDSIGNRTRDLPISGAVSQPTAPPVCEVRQISNLPHSNSPANWFRWCVLIVYIPPHKHVINLTRSVYWIHFHKFFRLGTDISRSPDVPCSQYIRYATTYICMDWNSSNYSWCLITYILPCDSNFMTSK
jgi:hypothetical protein